MPKIRVRCSDPYATDCSSDSDDDDDEQESIEENNPKIGGLFVKEISVSLPIIIPTISTFHFDSLANLKSDSSFRVDKPESSGDGHNCIVQALPAKKSEDIQSQRKSGIFSVQNRLEKLSMDKKCRVDVINSSSREDSSAEASPTSVNLTVDIPVAKSSRRSGASKHPPGLKLQSSGKWGVRMRHPFKRAQVWLGTYSTLEEATDIYNKKKLEYASLRSEMCREDASFKVDESKSGVATKKDAPFRVNESKSSMDRPNCIILALSAEPKYTPRNKRGICSVQTNLEKLCMAQECQFDITSSSSKEGGSALTSPTSDKLAVDISVAKTSRSLGAEKHPGLKLTTSGKYGVQIRHPVTRSRIWLGTYSAVEEATNIYNKKKLEYESLRPAVMKHKKHSVLKAKRKGKGKRKRQKLVIEGITVWETVSGRWGISIYDPVSKLKVWLGSHATPEEAMESYNRKMLEFDSSYNCTSVGKGSSVVHGSDILGKEAVNGACIPACDTADVCIPAHDVASSVATNITDIEHPVVKLTDADKWRVAIRHPMLKYSLFLGSYDTAEEAEEVYNADKLELEAVLNSDKIACQKERLADVASPNVVGSEGVGVKKYKGVRPSGTGRWMSQIQSPFKRKSKVYLGTYKTAEDAADAFNRTRREFDAIVSLVKKRKHEGDCEAHKAESKSKKAVVLEETGMANGERTRLFEIMVGPQPYNEKSAITSVVSSQGSNYSNNRQILEVSPADQDSGMDVIDSCGQLVGEYSRLDDELWLSRPGDDDEFDVNGAVFDGFGELPWDPNPKPSLFLLN